MNANNDLIDSFQGYYRFLSNFWVAMVFYDDRAWPSSEHAFQAMKTLDKDQQEAIRVCKSPGAAKKFGRKVTIRGDWDEIKVGIMADIVREKFKQNPLLLRRLLGTGEQILIEGNTWHDQAWGDCNCNKRIECQAQGQNHLGEILMKVREELRNA